MVNIVENNNSIFTMPMTLLARLLLCAPYYRDADGKIKVSKIECALGLLLQLAMLVYFNIRDVFYRVDWSALKNDPFLVLSFAHRVVESYYRAVLCIKAAYNHTKTVEMINEVINLMKTLHMTKSIRRLLFLKSITEVTALIVIAATITICMMPDEDLLRHVMHFYLIVTITLHELQMTQILVVFRRLMVQLNFNIETLTDSNEQEIWAVQLFHPESIQKKKMKSLSTHHKLQCLRRQYRRMWELKEIAARIYGLQLFITFSFGFIDLLYYSFINRNLSLTFGEILDKPGTSKPAGVKIINTGLGVKFIMTTNIIHWLTEDFKETGSHLHGLWYKTEDKEVRDEIESFSGELLHLNPGFSALGVFDINNGLLLGMLGTLTMYLIILLQANLEGPNGSNPIESLLKFA